MAIDNENEHDNEDAAADEADCGDDKANVGGQVRQRRSYGREDRQKSTYQSLSSDLCTLLPTKY